MKRLWLLIFFLALLAPARALCQQARDITALCAIRANTYNADVPNMTDGSYQTHYKTNSVSKAYIRITAPKDAQIGALYLCFSDRPKPFGIQAQNESGEWTLLSEYDSPLYYNHFVALPKGYDAVRIVPHSRDGQRFSIAEIKIFTPGDAPAGIQQWQMPPDKVDLLMLVAHPDDEVIFLGGVLPTYAGELQKKVMVAVLVSTPSYRKNELLDSLWTCGVRYYPVIGPFNDVYETSLERMYKHWSKTRVLSFVSDLMRACRPDVVVTHDIKGEYGHGAHRVAASAALNAMAMANTQGEDGAPPWQVKKLYIHLYPEHQVVMDWRKPLSAFGGKTALEVSKEAFLCHVSQQSTKYSVCEDGPYDCAKYGLAYTTVGRDSGRGSFFENVYGPDEFLVVDEDW